MTLELISLIVRANLVLAAAILLVLVLRGPARRAFGARVAYALWLIPLLAAAMCFAPARIVHVVLPADDLSYLPLAAAPTDRLTPTLPPLLPAILLSLWAGGVLLCLGVLALRQHRFVGALGRLAPRADLGARVFAAQSAAHGPAVIGVLRPVIITPADFDQRFSDEEQAIVLAHERAHMAQGDPLINATAALLSSVNWFNPLIHLAQRALRTDQELACDAAVLEHAQRRSYAEAMLKTQIAVAAPLGCAWPSQSQSSLKERIAMLKSSLPSPAQRVLGATVVVAASFAACAAAWSAQPPRVEITSAPSTADEEHSQAKLDRALARMQRSAPDTPDAYAAPTPPDAYAAPAPLAEPVAPALHAGATPHVAPVAPTPHSAPTPMVAPIAMALAAPQASEAPPAPPAPVAEPDLDGSPHADRHVRRHIDIDTDNNGHGVVVMDGHTYRWEDLSPEQRAEIQADVERARARAHDAMERAHAAMSSQRQAEIQERVARAMARQQDALRRASEATRVRIRDRDVMMSPEMRAELQAVTSEASRMATLATSESASSEQTQRELERMRADIQAHSERLRQMAEQMRTSEEPAPRAQHGDHD